MDIQWFPGHMNKAKKEIEKALPQVDVVIEVLDSRIPYSSQNFMLQSMIGKQRVIKLLGKSDLADSSLSSDWIKYFQSQPGTTAYSITTERRGQIRQIVENAIGEVKKTKGFAKNLTTMIVGVPNVGKSTLINILTGRSIAKTGNEPAVTKGQQRIHLGDGILLLDTPGMMVPKIDNPNSGFRLAICSAIKDTALDYGEVGLYLLRYLLENHLPVLVKRYDVEKDFSGNVYQLFDWIGQKRGCLSKRSGVDYDRVGRAVIQDFRSGKLGPMTIETPDMIENEMEELKNRPAKKSMTGPPSRKKEVDDLVQEMGKENKSCSRKRQSSKNASPNNRIKNASSKKTSLKNRKRNR